MFIFASSAHLSLFFASNSVLFVGGGRKNISCFSVQGTLATLLIETVANRLQHILPVPELKLQTFCTIIRHASEAFTFLLSCLYYNHVTYCKYSQV